MSKKDNKPSRHHRRCRSNHGSNDESNISMVSVKKHQAWHTLFQAMTPEMICDEINRVWLDPDYEFICIKRGE